MKERKSSNLNNIAGIYFFIKFYSNLALYIRVFFFYKQKFIKNKIIFRTRLQAP